MARKKGFGCLALASRLARNSFCAGSTSLIADGIRTSIDAANEIPIAFQEIELCQLPGRRPQHLMKNQVGRLALEFLHPEENQPDRILAGISVLVARDFPPASAGNPELLFEFTPERLLRCFARLDFPAGKLPLERMRLLRHPAANQDLSLAHDDRSHHLNHANIGAYLDRIAFRSSPDALNLPDRFLSDRIA